MKEPAKEADPRILIAVTDDLSALLLRGQLAAARERGFEVFVMASDGMLLRNAANIEGATHVPVSMSRRMDLFGSVLSLLRVIYEVQRIRPSIVNAGTPKAGLLVMLAATVAGVPCKVYTLRGLPSETLGGIRGSVVLAATRITCRLAHRVVCISPSLRRRAVALGLVTEKKAVVVASGSSNGTDVERFKFTRKTQVAGLKLRERLGIARNGEVVGFVGRLAQDKGVFELAEAWEQLSKKRGHAHLLLVGPIDEDCHELRSIVRRLAEQPRVHLLGLTVDPVPAYAAMDVLVLPSYREGFGNVLIEAAAMQVPVVATDIVGVSDAVEHGVTGTLVPPRNPNHLKVAICKYIDDPSLRREHGLAGRARVRRLFRQERVWSGLHALYEELLYERQRDQARKLHGSVLPVKSMQDLDAGGNRRQRHGV